MSEKSSKDETDYFMKVATNVMFTQISAKAGVEKLDKK